MSNKLTIGRKKTYRLIERKKIGLEPVFSHTEKSCIALYYQQFFTNIKIKIKKIILGANKTGFNYIIFISISAESCL